jgi:hypothetical protein
MSQISQMSQMRRSGHMSRTRLAGLATALIAAGLVLAPLSPAAACACGGVAPAPGSEVAVGEERAIVSWDDGVEQIEMLLGVLSSDTETGLVFPTPSPATVSLGDREDFEAIGRVTTPTRVEEYDWWGAASGGGDGVAGGAPPEVLASVQLGPIEAVTLAASDTNALATWLADNDFQLAPAVTDLLEVYVERGWYFVAVRLTGDEPLDGSLDPLVFSFESEALVYPLELSRAATSPQTVRLYVFDDHRQRVTFVGGGEPSPSFASWAAPVSGTEVEDFGAYLTVFELYFDDPGTQILADLEFSDALDDETTGTEYYVTVPVALGPVPAGWLIVLFAVLGVVGTMLVIGSVGAKRS